MFTTNCTCWRAQADNSRAEKLKIMKEGSGPAQLLRLYNPPICLNSCRCVLHLHVLMTHESPGSQVPRIQLQRPLKVECCLLMLWAQTIVVPCSKGNNQRSEGNLGMPPLATSHVSKAPATSFIPPSSKLRRKGLSPITQQVSTRYLSISQRLWAK